MQFIRLFTMGDGKLLQDRTKIKSNVIALKLLLTNRCDYSELLQVYHCLNATFSSTYLNLFQNFQLQNSQPFEIFAQS